MMKATTTVRAPIDVLVDCAIDFEVRQKWDNVLYDFKVFAMSKDRTHARVSYCFKSPAPPVADRDFYLQQLVRWDCPTPGTVAMHVSSLPADEE